MTGVCECGKPDGVLSTILVLRLSIWVGSLFPNEILPARSIIGALFYFTPSIMDHLPPVHFGFF